MTVSFQYKARHLYKIAQHANSSMTRDTRAQFTDETSEGSGGKSGPRGQT